jgi:hypothetical protein
VTTLDINTNGSWRTVISDLPQSKADQVKAACIVLVAASARPRAGGAIDGISFRLRDAENTAYAHCVAVQDEHAISGQWRYR